MSHTPHILASPVDCTFCMRTHPNRKSSHSQYRQSQMNKVCNCRWTYHITGMLLTRLSPLNPKWTQLNKKRMCLRPNSPCNLDECQNKADTWKWSCWEKTKTHKHHTSLQLCSFDSSEDCMFCHKDTDSLWDWEDTLFRRQCKWLSWCILCIEASQMSTKDMKLQARLNPSTIRLRILSSENCSHRLCIWRSAHCIKCRFGQWRCGSARRNLRQSSIQCKKRHSDSHFVGNLELRLSSWVCMREEKVWGYSRGQKRQYWWGKWLQCNWCRKHRCHQWGEICCLVCRRSTWICREGRICHRWVECSWDKE